MHGRRPLPLTEPRPKVDREGKYLNWEGKRESAFCTPRPDLDREEGIGLPEPLASWPMS